MAEYSVPVRIEVDKFFDVEADSENEAMKKAEKAAKNAYPEGYPSAFTPTSKLEDKVDK